MLSKILGIRHVGRIDSKAPVELHQLTVIYGDNGRGKTTLSAILRSLASGESSHILERRTLLCDEEPLVTVKSDSVKAPLAFKNGTWTATLPNVEVFDARFIADNVYAGSAVEHEHKRQLHHFVMGAEGVALAKAVDDHDAAIRVINGEIQAAEERVRLRIADARAAGMDLERFLALPVDPGVASRIEEQKQRVEAARGAKALAAKATLTIPTLPNIDRAAVEALLALGVSQVAAGAEEMTRRHVERCLGAKGREWLAAGVQHLDARATARRSGTPGCDAPGHDDPSVEPCPFCGADVAANSLVGAFRAFFSDSYRDLSARLSAAASDIAQQFGEGPRTALRHVVEQNDLLVDWWSAYGVFMDARLDCDVVLAAHQELGTRLAARIGAKRAAPLETLTLDTDDRAALQTYERALAAVEAYSVAAAAANVAIAEVKARAGSANLADEERRLWELMCQQRRHDPEIAEECERHAGLLSRKKQADADKQAARTLLDEYAKTVFTTYQASINQHLQNCGCGYSIGGTKVTYTGGRPSTDYHLSITGKSIPLTPNKKDPLAPSFRNTLSEGDKSTLAFAFFLARLDLDPKLADKIVVFDDPITSQDNHRRVWTRKQILRIAGKCRQVVVLTHDMVFARQVWEEARIDCRALHLERDGERSVLASWDIARATESSYFKHHRTLTSFVAEGAKGADLRVIAQSIRPMLEGNLRIRFPEHFGHGEWLGGFLKTVREADEEHPLCAMQAQLEELDDICSYSNRYHHDQNPGWEDEPVVDGELSSYARRALVVARGAMASAAA